MTKSLLAILLLLPMIAQTGERRRLEDVSSESANAMQKQFRVIGDKILTELNLERRFKAV